MAHGALAQLDWPSHEQEKFDWRTHMGRGDEGGTLLQKGSTPTSHDI